MEGIRDPDTGVIFSVVQIVNGRRACNESNPIRTDDPPRSEHALAISELAFLEGTIPYAFDEKVSTHFYCPTVQKRDESTALMNIRYPGEFGEGGIR